MLKEKRLIKGGVVGLLYLEIFLHNLILLVRALDSHSLRRQCQCNNS